MAETQVASSPTETVDVFNGENTTMAEFAKYRQDGEVPERFRTAAAESAPDGTQEKTGKPVAEKPELAPDSEPDESQELPPKAKPHEKRILQLLEKQRELERQLAEKQDAKPAASSPVAASVVQAGEPNPEDKNDDGTPKFKTYEEFTRALARWEIRLELEADRQRAQEREANKALQSKLEDARTRYDDADDVIFPTSKSIHDAQIPVAVKEVFGQSDVFVDLCYVVGSDPEELKKFIALAQSNPRAAIGKVFEYERCIKEQLSKASDDKDSAPAPKKTGAPKPPAPVSGASSRAFDVSDDSLSPEEWARKRTKQLADKRA